MLLVRKGAITFQDLEFSRRNQCPVAFTLFTNAETFQGYTLVDLCPGYSSSARLFHAKKLYPINQLDKFPSCAITRIL